MYVRGRERERARERESERERERESRSGGRKHRGEMVWTGRNRRGRVTTTFIKGVELS
jgi:hypothetical protein